MKALVLEEYKTLAYTDMPTPAPGPEEVLIAVRACGICGSDVHGMDGSTGRRRPPIIMGHEAAGVIADLGAAVKGWTVGSAVTFDSTIYCGRCEYCRRGEINLCDNRRVLGVSCEDYHQDGAFAEFVVVPQNILCRVPEGLSFEHAALVEPFSIALHAVGRTPHIAGSTVIVVGAGMIGLALVQALRQGACARIAAVDVVDARLELAKSLGANDVINSSTADAPQVILDLTHGCGADAAFDAVGVGVTANLAIGCLRKGGAVTLIGNLAPKVEFPLQMAVTRELSIYGSCASCGEFSTALEMLAHGTLNARPLISAVAPLADGSMWFDRLYRKEPGLMKVLLKP